MRMNGVSEWDTQTQLGHRRPGVTEFYTGYDPGYLREECTALNKLVRQIIARDADGGGVRSDKALKIN
jgi:hypothetical protein